MAAFCCGGWGLGGGVMIIIAVVIEVGLASLRCWDSDFRFLGVGRALFLTRDTS